MNFSANYKCSSLFYFLFTSKKKMLRGEVEVKQGKRGTGQKDLISNYVGDGG